MLDAKILLKEVIPYLSGGKVGKQRELDLLEIVQAIFHRLKTGCQWRELPVKAFISRTGTKWTAIYYHYHKWCEDGSWQRAWVNILSKYKAYLDMSCVNLDGSQTRAYKGGQAIGYQGRKKYQSTNMLFIIDNQGVILFCSHPVSGAHHDLYDIEKQFEQIVEMAQQAGIELRYLFMNADAGFDDAAFRRLLEEKDIQANIAFNPRKAGISDRDEYFDEALYQRRAFAEHAFAWMDGFKGLLIRYETLASTWLAMNLMGMIHLFLRKISKHII